MHINYHATMEMCINHTRNLNINYHATMEMCINQMPYTAHEQHQHPLLTSTCFMLVVTVISNQVLLLSSAEEQGEKN